LQPLLRLLSEISPLIKVDVFEKGTNLLELYINDDMTQKILAAVSCSGVLEHGSSSEDARRLWSNMPDDLSSEGTQGHIDWVFYLTRAERFCSGSVFHVAENGTLFRVVGELAKRWGG